MINTIEAMHEIPTIELVGKIDHTKYEPAIVDLEQHSASQSLLSRADPYINSRSPMSMLSSLSGLKYLNQERDYYQSFDSLNTQLLNYHRNMNEEAYQGQQGEVN